MLRIKEIEKKDHKKAIQLSITGMHFNWYSDKNYVLNMYGRYFWYKELLKATDVIAAYENDVFVGVLVVRMVDKPLVYHSMFNRFYVFMVDLFYGLFSSKGAGVYEKTTIEFETNFLKRKKADGEFLFFVTDPSTHGVGTALLEELKSRYPGKTMYLQTDDGCTVAFYEKRGFFREYEKSIVLEIDHKKVELCCFLYSKTL